MRSLPKVSMDEALAMNAEDGPPSVASQSLEKAVIRINDDYVVVKQAFAALEDIAITEEMVKLAANHRGKIVAAHSSTIEKMLEIGNFLIDLKQKLPYRAFSRFLQADLLPFDDSHASKLIKIAEAAPTFARIIGPDYAPSQLPAFTVCYQLSTMPEDRLLEAKAAGLLRHSATQKLVTEFKTRIKTESAGQITLMRLLTAKRNEHARVQLKADKLKDEVDELVRRIDRDDPTEQQKPS